MYLDKTWLNSQEANVLSAAISAMNTARRNDTTGQFDADQWVTDNLPTIMHNKYQVSQVKMLHWYSELKDTQERKY